MEPVVRVESVAEILERTKGRTIFACHHPTESRKRYDDMCEVCWDCRSVRGKTEFGRRWLSVVRVQLADRTMVDLDGKPVAADWTVSSQSSPRTGRHTQTT